MDRKLLVIATVLTLGACSNATSSDSQPVDTASSPAAVPGPVGSSSPPPATSGSEAVLLRLPDSKEGDGAAIEGRLAVEDGCVGITAGDGFYVLAPTDPAIRWSGGALTLSDGTSARVGARLLLGGSEASDPGTLPFVETVPAVCTGKRMWVTASATAG